MIRTPLALLAVAAALAACGGDDHDHDHGADAGIDCSLIMEGQDVYSPGLEKVGDAGYAVRLLMSDPAPPARGDNTWTIEVVDASDAPVDGLEIDVDTWMPHHQHGSPIHADDMPAGAPGQYTLAPVNLFMPGIWEVTLHLMQNGSEVDSVVYTFCIDG
ncbi:MAG: hypothetical protein D6689_02005 [Deltaproteobacteria bacterium]|nr:MAG: hypothetical protein D6689_02005 [Deltaproteobacteria bacterium]